MLEALHLYLLLMLCFAKSWSQRTVSCFQLRDSGVLCDRQPTSLYYWDVTEKKCKIFQHLGCGGTENQFPTLSACLQTCSNLAKCPVGNPLNDDAGYVQHCHKVQSSCPPGFECVDTDSTGLAESAICCPSKDAICGLPVDAGSRCLGVPLLNRFFYDPMARVCRVFNYLGCGGNENNFATKNECLNFCSDGVLCERGDPLGQQGSPYLRECDGQNPCPDTHECVSKRFRIADIPYSSLCCPKQSFVCTQNRDAGVSCSLEGASTRWLYDATTGVCDSFRFAGCHGNLNNFLNEEQCLTYCLGKCPEGTEPYHDPITHQTRICNRNASALYDTCPEGYACVQSSVGSSLCCKTPPKCPGDAEMYRDPATGSAVFCKIGDGISKRCPGEFVCTRGNTKEYICCMIPVECPSGFLTLREAVSGGIDVQPRYCAPGVPGGCPNNHICTRAAMDKFICCAAQKQCVLPYVERETLTARTCIPGITVCPARTQCLQNAADMKYYCCVDVEYSRCLDGSLPYYRPLETRPLPCLPLFMRRRQRQFRPNLDVPEIEGPDCPANFQCTELRDKNFGCCRLAQVDELCHIAYVDRQTQNAIRCTQANSALVCPTGTFCQKASDNNFYCCER